MGEIANVWKPVCDALPRYAMLLPTVFALVHTGQVHAALSALMHMQTASAYSGMFSRRKV